MAKDLYISALFLGRRSYVERTCEAWRILSAEYGLVDPDEMLQPYDKALKDLGRKERRAWTREVLSAIDRILQPAPGDIFEIHAGAEYRDFGLVDGLISRGCHVENPTQGKRSVISFSSTSRPGSGCERPSVQSRQSLPAVGRSRGKRRRKAQVVGVHRTDGVAQTRGLLLLRGGRASPGRQYAASSSRRHPCTRPSKSTLWGRLSQHKGVGTGSTPAAAIIEGPSSGCMWARRSLPRAIGLSRFEKPGLRDRPPIGRFDWLNTPSSES